MGINKKAGHQMVNLEKNPDKWFSVQKIFFDIIQYVVAW
jgi:hypothetical protein